MKEPPGADKRKPYRSYYNWSLREPLARWLEQEGRTAAGLRVLAATHGSYVYHPGPADHWRWTHTGLRRLFEGAGDWRSVEVEPGAGTAAALGLLVALYVDQVAQRLHAVWAGRLVNYAINSLASALERRAPSLREPIPGSLTTNFHIVALR